MSNSLKIGFFLFLFSLILYSVVFIHHLYVDVSVFYYLLWFYDVLPSIICEVLTFSFHCILGCPLGLLPSTFISKIFVGLSSYVLGVHTNICLLYTSCQCLVLLQLWDVWERTFGEKTCPALAVGCSIMTMHPLTEC